MTKKNPAQEDQATQASSPSQPRPEATEESGIFPSGTILGSYRLSRILGEGGMGAVYLAEHVRIGRKVAIKTLHSDYAGQREVVKRFFAEARAANQISHENIVEITDFVEEEASSVYYLVMEHLEGMDLRDLLKKEEILPLERSLNIALQMAHALYAAHEAGIIHRDLKPGNIFLTSRSDQEEFVKLLDFGVAKLTEGKRNLPGGLAIDDTAPGIILGTPSYMSPEQAGAKKLDHRSDIYSFGVILFRMVAGQTPFVAEEIGDYLIQHMTVAPPRPSSIKDLPHRIPKKLEDLILSCLEKKPDDRPNDMDEVRQSLEEIVEQLPEEGERHPSSSRGLWIAAVALIVIILSVGGYMAFYPPPPTDERPQADAASVIGTKVADADVGNTGREAAVVDGDGDQDADSPDERHVVISFGSAPSGAEVWRQGEPGPLGVTPFELFTDKTTDRVAFELRKKGYFSSFYELSLDDDSEVNVKLRPIVTDADVADADTGEADISDADVSAEDSDLDSGLIKTKAPEKRPRWRSKRGQWKKRAGVPGQKIRTKIKTKAKSSVRDLEAVVDPYED